MGRFDSPSGCDRAREQMSMALDGELSRRSALGLRAHTSVCSSCRRYRQELGSITDVLRADRLPQRQSVAVTVPRVAAVGFAVVCIAVAGAVVTSSGEHPEQGGALQGGQGTPIYDTSVFRIPR
jgi:Putative zinc-finger